MHVRRPAQVPLAFPDRVASRFAEPFALAAETRPLGCTWVINEVDRLMVRPKVLSSNAEVP